MKIGAILLAMSLGITGLQAQFSMIETCGEAPDGTPLKRFTLKNSDGLEARILSYGATLISLEVPDRNGRMDNVTLSLDSPEDYLESHPLLGSVVGRYANRIDKGGFTIDGQRYDLETINAKTGVHIHGGKTGFQRQNWKGTEVSGPEYAGVRFELVSPDGHEGFPGEVTASVTYILNNANELRLVYEASTTKPTHINLTNHTYWNLSGAGSGTVLHHKLQLNAARYLDVDERKIPTGSLKPVMQTPMDFTLPSKIGQRIHEVPGGYDHCYVIKHLKPGDLSFAAKVIDRRSGRIMEVWTTAPGVQVYTANHLSEKFGSRGKPYGPHHGLCLESQHFPDSPNRSTFPSSLLRPGQTYRQETVHKFFIAD